MPLSAESPRRAAARKFGVLLRRTMERRDIGTKRLAPAAGVATSAIACWRAGSNLPTLRVALRVAESLDEPRLAELVRDARMGSCERCGRGFINEGGKPKRFCGPDCRDMTAADRKKGATGAIAARSSALDILRVELLRIGPARKQQIGKALTLLTDEEERSPGLVARRRLPVFEQAIARFCATCEPLGYCRDDGCPLRAVSPLALLTDGREARPATKALGAWGTPERAAAHIEATRAGNARRWSKPGERERAGELHRKRHADMTPEQREAWVASIRASKARRPDRGDDTVTERSA